MGGARRLGRGRLQRRRQDEKGWRERRSVCEARDAGVGEKERLRIISIRRGSRHHRRRSVVERQTAGATRTPWTSGERVRCARVCESSTSSTNGAGSAVRSWVSVCVVGRGRSAPEKKEERPKGDQARRFSSVRGHAPFTVVAVNWHFYASARGLCDMCWTRGPPPDRRESALHKIFESINHINLSKPLILSMIGATLTTLANTHSALRAASARSRSRRSSLSRFR